MTSTPPPCQLLFQFAVGADLVFSVNDLPGSNGTRYQAIRILIAHWKNLDRLYDFRFELAKSDHGDEPAPQSPRVTTGRPAIIVFSWKLLKSLPSKGQKRIVAFRTQTRGFRPSPEDLAEYQREMDVMLNRLIDTFNISPHLHTLYRQNIIQ
ncbi:unnamed protein product, partial [Mesorhabditis spiculigera]